MASIPIGELLVDNGQITPEELEQAEAETKKTGEPIAAVLSKLGFITENSLKNALELQYGVMYMNLSKREPEHELISLLPEQVIREQQAVPVAQQGDRLTVAMVDPNDSKAFDVVSRSVKGGKQVKAVVCLEEQFVKFVDQAFNKTSNGNGAAQSVLNGAKPSEASTKEIEAEKPSESAKEIEAEKPDGSDSKPTESKIYSEQPTFDTQEMKARPAPGSAEAAPTAAAAKEEEPAPKVESSDSVTEHDLAKRAQEEAIVLLANQILGSAIKRHCSNIHITMNQRESLVHYRMNGRLILDRKLPNTIVTALVARYKMMARLNLAERKEPQDGHIKVKSASKEIVCLISVVPQDHGENVVIWIV